MKKIIVFAGLFLVACSVSANIRLPKLFNDHMVLQRDQSIPVWGWADPKEKVTIRFNHQTKTATTDKTGKWIIRLDPEPAGGPFEMTIAGKNNLAIRDILLGEVWICSGQSNMEFNLQSVNDAEAEIQAANFPRIRHFEVQKHIASAPMQDVAGGEWKMCSPETAGKFTAVGYFFARDLQAALDVPIGLIHTSWGGTHSETWTSRQAFENSDEFKEMIAAMPTLDLDSLAKQKQAATSNRLRQMQPGFPASADQIAHWKSVDFNDSGWPKIKVPGLWEQQALGDFDGTVWFRKTIDMAAADAGQAAVLELGMIDDADECYLNGTKLGSTDGYNIKRKYDVPPGIVKQGKNVIAVRVNDTGGGGGIYGESSAIKILTGSSNHALDGEWSFQVESVLEGSASIGPNTYPSLLSNGMLEPLIPFAIKGAIWYQGESNAGRAYQYRKAFPLMITDWRKRWNQGDFPFYFVQLASFNSNNGDSRRGSTWAELREAQTMTLSLPNTGMAVTTDIGNPTDIHPTNKKDVGKRLAAIALNKTYGKTMVSAGPAYQSFLVQGNKLTLTFTNTGSGLSVHNKYGYLQGFEIAGTDRRFYPAKAEIQGDKVIVYSDSVANPVAARLGWADNAGEDNLFNNEGFPAGPFRTDDWKGITEENKFSIGN